MNYTIEKCNTSPAYMQLYALLRKDIVDGVYPYGAKLPSKRTLAAETGLSVIPVEHAFVLLCEEGYAESRQRSGYFVIYRESDFVSKSHGSSAVVVFEPTKSEVHSGISFDLLSKTMRRVILDYGDRLLIKSPNRGCDVLRAAIAAYLARSSGIKVSSGQIVIGSGAEYLYSMLVQLLGNHRVFALENPSYEKIKQVYTANGVQCEMLKLGGNGIQSYALRSTKATVLHVTPFNSYPSGISADASKRREYIRWACARDGYIIEDNYDSELTVSRKNDDTIFALCEEPRVIYLNTFSHTVAPSVRVGYMVLPHMLVEQFEEKLGFYSCTVPVFEQYVLAELLRNGDFERHINRVRRQKRKQLSE